MRASGIPRTSSDLGDGIGAGRRPGSVPDRQRQVGGPAGLADRMDARHPLARRLRLRQPRLAARRRDVPGVRRRRISRCPTARSTRARTSSVADDVELRAIATPGPHTRPPRLPPRRRRRPRRAVLRRFADGRRGRAHRPARRRAGASRWRARCSGLCAPRSSRCPTTCPSIPTHGAGSFCSAPAGASSDQHHRPRDATNPLLRHRRRRPVRRDAARGARDASRATFAELPELNRRGPRLLPHRSRSGPARPRRRRSGTSPTVPYSSTPGRSTRSRRSHPRSRSRSRCDRCSPVGSAGSSPSTSPSCSSSTTPPTAPTSSASASTVGHEAIVGELDGGIDAWAAAGPAGRARSPLVAPSRDGRDGDRCPPEPASTAPATSPARSTSSSAS